MNIKIKIDIFLIFITVLVDIMSCAFIFPLYPFYAGDSSIIMYSILCISYPTAQFLCIINLIILIGLIPFGYASDKFGRKKILLISLFGSACGSILQGLSSNLNYLIVFRFISGLFGTSVVSCQSYIVDCIKEDEKSKYLSQIMGFSTIATAVGPLISSELYTIKTNFPFLLSGILYGICFILILLFLNESPKFDNKNRSILIIIYNNRK